MNLNERFTKEIKHSPVYAPADDLWIISSFFNSQNYATRLNNYKSFINSLEQSGLHYIIVECAFNKQPFSLPDSPNILKVRSDSVLWQKERLLNIAISSLPPNCTKIAWVDCDVLFENEFWAIETSKLLDTYKVIQPFDFVVRLPKDTTYYKGKGDFWESFASVYQKNNYKMPIGDFQLHGHTGFAWAIRKDIISKFGLFDTGIAGSGDHLMAHAFCGDFHSNCINQLIGADKVVNNNFQEWAHAIYQEVSGNIGFVSGTLLHLWHGDSINRQYLRRHQELLEFKFNPYEDISINKDGCWEWNIKKSSKNNLKQWAIRYYESRKEDG